MNGFIMGDYGIMGRLIKYAWPYPEVVGELQGKDGDAFIVEGASNGTGDVAGDDGDEAGGEQPCALVPQLSRQQEGGDGGQATEHRSQEHTHIADMDGDVQQVEHVVNEARCDHQAWVHLQDEGKIRTERTQDQFRHANQIEFSQRFYKGQVLFSLTLSLNDHKQILFVSPHVDVMRSAPLSTVRAQNKRKCCHTHRLTAMTAKCLH